MCLQLGGGTTKEERNMAEITHNKGPSTLRKNEMLRLYAQVHGPYNTPKNEEEKACINVAKFLGGTSAFLYTKEVKYKS